MARIWTAITVLGLLVSMPAATLADETVVLRALNEAYRTAWLKNDSAAVMSLFEIDARISPSGICPIEGIEAMRSFWFPEDGSVTTIHRYEAQTLSAVVLEELGVTTERTLLEWSYEKGDTRMGRIQEGVNTTVFRRRSDGTWKIWRKMWTDLAVSDRK